MQIDDKDQGQTGAQETGLDTSRPENSNDNATAEVGPGNTDAAEEDAEPGSTDLEDVSENDLLEDDDESDDEDDQE